MPTHDFSDQEYRQTFSTENGRVHENALRSALEIRKFEIDLYWRRATYFWTFIAATTAGFVAIQASGSDAKEPLSVLLANLGIAFSVAWYCANRGSKHWQENWEKHVDMLEDDVQGPLYKVILTRSRPKGWKEWSIHVLTGPSEFSVSKVNQLISAYVALLWMGLLAYALPPFDLDNDIHWPYVSVCALTLLLCVSFFTVGKTYHGGYWHRAKIRTSQIKNDTPAVSPN